MLDASAGSGAARADGGNSPRAADGTVAAKLQDGTADTPSIPGKTAGTPAAPPNGTEKDCQAIDPSAPVATPLDLAILVQAIPAGVVANPSPGVPSGKSNDATEAPIAAEADQPKGKDDAPPFRVIPDAATPTMPAPTIVPVAAPPAAAADVSASPDTQANAVAAVPSVRSQVLAPVDTNKAPASEPAQPIAAAPDGIAVAAESDATASTPEVAAETTDKSPSAQPAATSDEPVKAGAVAGAALAETDAKAPPLIGARMENPNAEGDKPTKTEKAGTTKAASGTDANPPQPQPAADETHITSHLAEKDSKAPAPHQPNGQPSEHASATARAAFTAAHGDVLTPTAIAQAVTAQIGGNPAAFGLAIPAPASPLQTLWQAAPQRAESNDNTVPIAGVAVEIVSRVQDGLRRFEIRLDPPELGRIDVRLDVDKGGNVTSRLTVERAETLDLLRRDAPQLERALQHAGLNTEGGLQFSLRDQNFANRDQTPRNAPTFIVPDDESAAAEAGRRGYGRLLGLGGGIDIRV